MPGPSNTLPHAGRASVLQRHGFLGAAARFAQRSYAADYLGFAVLLALLIVHSIFAEPFHRLFRLDDPRIQFPHAEQERVPVAWLFIYALAVPAGLIALYIIIARPGVHKAHVTSLGFFVSVLLTLFLTDVVKNAVGRPRPDLLARCKPAVGTPDNELVDWHVCTEERHHILHDGWRSFPSGHSSFAFSGLGYLALVLAGQMHIFRPRVDLARVLIALAPIIGAALIAVSRLEDYRHDVGDVTCGSLLGLFISYFTYRRYYPSLRKPRCETPYPNPADDSSFAGSGKGYGRVKDEEERIGGAEDFDIGGESEEEDGNGKDRRRRESYPLVESRPGSRQSDR